MPNERLRIQNRLDDLYAALRDAKTADVRQLIVESIEECERKLAKVIAAEASPADGGAAPAAGS